MLATTMQVPDCGPPVPLSDSSDDSSRSGVATSDIELAIWSPKSAEPLQSPQSKATSGGEESVEDVDIESGEELVPEDNRLLHIPSLCSMFYFQLIKAAAILMAVSSALRICRENLRFLRITKPSIWHIQRRLCMFVNFRGAHGRGVLRAGGRAQGHVRGARRALPAHGRLRRVPVLHRGEALVLHDRHVRLQHRDGVVSGHVRAGGGGRLRGHAAVRPRPQRAFPVPGMFIVLELYLGFGAFPEAMDNLCLLRSRWWCPNSSPWPSRSLL